MKTMILELVEMYQQGINFELRYMNYHVHTHLSYHCNALNEYKTNLSKLC